MTQENPRIQNARDILGDQSDRFRGPVAGKWAEYVHSEDLEALTQENPWLQNAAAILGDQSDNFRGPVKDKWETYIASQDLEALSPQDLGLRNARAILGPLLAETLEELAERAAFRLEDP